MATNSFMWEQMVTWRAVSVDGTGAGIVTGPASQLFQLNPQLLGSTAYLYDVAREGERFVVNKLSGDGRTDPLTVLVNWTDLTPQ